MPENYFQLSAKDQADALAAGAAASGRAAASSGKGHLGRVVAIDAL
jgi:hypothetical protein